MGSQIESDDERPRAVRGSERGGLPSARGKPQRRVLQLRLGRGERDRQLAEDLGVRVEGVARRAPLLVGKLGPGRGHRHTLSAKRPSMLPDLLAGWLSGACAYVMDALGSVSSAALRSSTD
jgi:hypothetical protein